MHHLVRVLLPLATLISLAGAAPGQHLPDPPIPSVDRLVQVRLTADTASIAPGQSFHLAMIFQLEPHWHIYWQFAGDAGFPTELAVTAPAGFTLGQPLYPRPSTFRDKEGTTYVYEEEVVLFVPVTAPDALEADEAVFRVNATFLVCRGRCVLGDADQSITLPVTTEAPDDPQPSDERDKKLLESFRQRLPQPLKKLEGAEAAFQDGRLVATGPCPGHRSIEFFPIETPGVRFGRTEATVKDGRFRLAVDCEIRPQNARGRPMAIRGVIGLGVDSDEPCYHLNLPLDETEPP